MIEPKKPTSKRCNKCGKRRAISKFGPSKRSKDGYDYSCRECVAEYRREYYAAHKEQSKAYRKKNAKKIRENAKRWREKNAEYHREYNRQYATDHKEEAHKRYLKFKNKKRR